MTKQAFTGWPSTALEFFEGLEADNSKSYWLDHKDGYEQDVKAPMVALLAELEPEFGEARLFRPYRDTRFSADKSPYKTTIAATIGHGFVGLFAHGLQSGVGAHQMSPDQLDRYRAAVAADGSGKRLENLVGSLRAAGIEVNGSDELKTAPRGYPKDHPRVELLRYKGIVAMMSWPADSWISTPEVKSRVVNLFLAGAPLIDWLISNVGLTDRSEAARSPQ